MCWYCPTSLVVSCCVAKVLLPPIDERVRRNVLNTDSIFSRRRFLQISGAGILGMELLRSGGNMFLTPEIRAAEVTSPMTSEAALKELLAGNQRFVQSIKDNCVQRTPDRRMEVAEGQNPFAVILACADSRVSPEIIFDQWIGDLLQNTILENVRLGVSKLNNLDPVIAPMVKEGKVKVVGGNHDLVSGEVTLAV
jgi:hypothetical protein